MRSIEYVLWIIVTFFSLLIVRVLYKRNLAPIEKIVFSSVAGLVFLLLIGAFWFTTGMKFDHIAYDAIPCPLPLSRCESPLDERERKEQAKLERGPEKQAMLERTKLEREREERARLEREREERARLERERQERARLERQREERARLERQREERARLEREREERARLERERQERAKLERERQERAKLEQERQERAKLEQEREARARLEREEQRRSQRFAAMAVGISGRRLFAITARDMPSYAYAEANALARCNQEVSDCRIEATFSGAGKCGYAAAGIAHAPLFGAPDMRGGVRTGPTANEAIERCEAIFRNCHIFHTSCNSP